MNRIITTLSLLSICALLAACGSSAGSSGGVATASQQTASHRVCFPASSWDAPEWQRPCVEVTRVEEDGSFEYRVTDAAGKHPTQAPAVRYTAGAGALDR